MVTLNFNFHAVARLPAPGDNVAIATRRLDAGSRIEAAPGGGEFVLPHTILEGHRFAISPIHPGDKLLSWGFPFGTASREIAPGDYACNEKILRALAARYVQFPLPTEPNFDDHYIKYQFDEAKFRPGTPNPRATVERTFDGFARAARRGVGTRNYVVVLGTSSWTASYARLLADRFKSAPGQFKNIDGVVAVAHTEGGETTKPNNFDLTLRTLAGFITNPNVGAVLAVDYGTEPVNNASLEEYLRKNNYPLDDVLNRFLSVRGGFQGALEEGQRIVNGWLGTVNQFHRAPHSLKHLRLGLQCGGSDAFSGVSGNPLVGYMAHELVRHGGSPNLAETDELIGAEEYILANTKDVETARSFLRVIDRFSEQAAWHGHNAEGNPSGGNNFRGLYNIAVKSIGAARKKAPETRLDWVIDFAQPMTEPGFYFMDSPGNDLESIAGQVGAGCNMIVFTTGNGSITNFPFVPTIKVVTTTGRYHLVKDEMDFNAGRYQDGEAMEALGAEAFELMLRVASGAQSVGEKAGHSQAQLWREWRETSRGAAEKVKQIPQPSSVPIRVKSAPPSPIKFRAVSGDRGLAIDQIGLLLPTSLCASQVARGIAERLNRNGPKNGVTRFVALPHTEGCGCSSGDSEDLMLRTLIGHLRHPSVRRGLLLEHGCEKTHNDAMRNRLEVDGLNASEFGWASIQMDGGIEAVTDKVSQWFTTSLESAAPAKATEAGWDRLCLGLTACGTVSPLIANSLAKTALAIVNTGGTVIVPQNSPLLTSEVFVHALTDETNLAPTIAYGTISQHRGLHIMATPTNHFVETLTGLAACGAQVILSGVSGRPAQGHPLVPTIQVTDENTLAGDVDLILREASSEPLLKIIAQTASREYTPKLFAQGNTDFQLTRGLLGVSL